MTDIPATVTTITEPAPREAKENVVTATLTVAYSPDEALFGKRLTLNRDEVLVAGREVPPDQLRLADPKLSRLHFRLLWDARHESYRVADAGSSNGTFINSSVVQNELLRRGDVLRAGQTLFVYEEGTWRSDFEQRLERLAKSSISVLITGETGTGKDVAARRIHVASGAAGKFVPVNCAALPRDLAASELFGHARGAFSGALQSRPGLFRSADRGTLFLDEIGELPTDLQASLLRCLQERAVRPVGGEFELPVDVRVIAATNRDLVGAMNQGSFREDLFARISTLQVVLPPLRDRRGEILPLLREFMRVDRLSELVTAQAAEALLLWSWPANIRELQALARAFWAARDDDELLDIRYLERVRPDLVGGTRAVNDTKETNGAHGGQAPSRAELAKLLQECNGNISLAAQKMKKPRMQIYRWMKRYGITARS